MYRLIFSNTKKFSRCLSQFNSPKKFPKLVTTQRNQEIRRNLRSCNIRPQMPKTPDLIYMPHIFRWIKSKLRLRYLRNIWDPEFSEGAFIYGTTKAVCRITEIINNGNIKDLSNLMTMSAKIKLEDDINYRLTSVQKKLIRLKPQDIKILVPISVNLTKNGYEKICKVNLRFLALKWHEVNRDNYKLVLVALQTEFLRDYSEGVPPDWSISAFSVLECAILSEATTIT